MNDNDLGATLRLIHQDRTRLVDPPALHRRVLSIPSSAPPRRAWLPPFSTWRFQTMFSATKFVVAGVIVALFGGFLLGGVLTQQSEDPLPVVGASVSASAQPDPIVEASDGTVPTPDQTSAAETVTRSDILPGVDLITEELHPGFLRVLSDGVRDLTDKGTTRSGIISGLDGSVWLFQRKTFFRLGDATTYEVSKNKGFLRYGLGGDDIEVGPDGVIWWADRGGEGLKSFDGQAWTVRRQRPAGRFGMVDQVEVLADGTVLASWRGGTSRKVARLGPDGWEVLANIDVPPVKKRQDTRAVLYANEMGDVWLSLNPGSGRIRTLYRGQYPEGVEGDFARVGLPPADVSRIYFADGTVWAVDPGQPAVTELPDRPSRPVAIFRLDGTTWTEYVLPDGLPEISWLGSITTDGSLWYVSSCVSSKYGMSVGSCELVRFDGREASRFGPINVDPGPRFLPIAPGETAWDSWDGPQGGLFVTTPEAVATTE